MSCLSTVQTVLYVLDMWVSHYNRFSKTGSKCWVLRSRACLEMMSTWGVKIRVRNETETDMEIEMEIRKEVNVVNVARGPTPAGLSLSGHGVQKQLKTTTTERKDAESLM